MLRTSSSCRENLSRTHANRSNISCSTNCDCASGNESPVHRFRRQACSTRSAVAYAAREIYSMRSAAAYAVSTPAQQQQQGIYSMHSAVAYAASTPAQQQQQGIYSMHSAAAYAVSTPAQQQGLHSSSVQQQQCDMQRRHRLSSKGYTALALMSICGRGGSGNTVI